MTAQGLIAACVVLATLSLGQFEDGFPWYDASISFEDRVDLLVSNMTVDELIHQMIKVGMIREANYVEPASCCPLLTAHCAHIHVSKRLKTA